ncbi:isoprenoid biosynthesis glyoxalase ElbB [Shewanella sp. 5_MG-2023]|uniref:isoprenoid biosynthesis glyoxalase ElbB n=1 Tax=Shewanella sp. 5_MG-2023 TaxID=3062656 RepID=UPI0026E21A94|nr:isoprenoid biosynthesis glyoxalase ElbB [Shewanella sp. 5_MG-2023]MDO6639509.1 isoprenoid biosynthesis glyoxalase ElbB [Shewanella sp. 5_MG-2023]
MKNIAVLFSGNGVFDGAEIQESVLTLLALSQAGASYHCFAPNINQLHVVNHLTGEVDVDAQRNVLEESARIARGEISDINALNIDQFDGLIVPGGFGAAKNLCDFAVAGSDCVLQPQVESFIQEFVLANKPMGFMCIAPIMLPRIFNNAPQGTIGNDSGTAQAFNEMGGEHLESTCADIVIDKQNRLVTTPAYMLATSIAEANVGIKKLVTEVLGMC